MLMSVVNMFLAKNLIDVRNGDVLVSYTFGIPKLIRRYWKATMVNSLLLKTVTTSVLLFPPFAPEKKSASLTPE